MMSDAMKLGFEAYLRGDDISLNPYDERDEQHHEWGIGYRRAEFCDSDYPHD